ncbi:MAG: sensor histidine kinase, partial [Chloroflexota bacterium]
RIVPPRGRPIPLRPRPPSPEGQELDVLFDAIVDGLRRAIRRLRQQVDKFGRAYQKRASSPDETTQRAFRRLRQLQLVAGHIESSAAYLLGSGLAPERRGKNEQLEVARRVLESLEAERERLYRDVHDGPAQVLANGIFEIEYLERVADRAPTDVRQTLRAELATLKAQFRSSLDAVRAMIYDLRPPVLSELGLAGALRNYAGEYEARYGLKVVCDLDVSETGLQAEQELAVYRVMQEALQNTHKHAHATIVRIDWGRVDASTWELRCVDDGIGFDIVRAARQPRAVGLLSMRERAELIGGSLQVQAAPGAGTTLTLRLGTQREETP